MESRFKLSVLLFILSESMAFITPTFHKSSSAKRLLTTPTEDFSLVLSLLQKVPKTQATGEFYFFFFAGSGALGIGAAQIPKIIDQYKSLSKFKGGPSSGGQALSVSPLLFYPEPILENDALSVIKNFPSIEVISKNGPKKSFLAQRGYLELDGFLNSFPKECNQLAIYAAFQSFSGGSDLASPSEAENKRLKWKAEGLKAFEADLARAAIFKLSAFSFFAFLIFLVLDLIIESANFAFFS